MGGCKVYAPETDEERAKRHWNMAQTIYSKLTGGCFNHVQLELFENIVMRVDALGIITYYYGNRTDDFEDNGWK